MVSTLSINFLADCRSFKIGNYEKSFKILDPDDVASLPTSG